MLTLDEIRKDLKEIRYYYSHKKPMDGAFLDVVSNSVMDKVKKYNEAVSVAPPQIYDTYINLYVKNNTQEGLSIEWGYTPKYIYWFNRKLLLFLQSQMND